MSNTTLATVSNDPSTYDDNGGLSSQNVCLLVIGILLTGLGFYYLAVVHRFREQKKGGSASSSTSQTLKLVNLALFILGLALCGVGAKSGDVGDGEAEIGWVLLVVGLVIICVSCVGLYGAHFDNAAFLFVYFGFSLLSSGFVAFTGAWVIMNRDDVERRIREKCDEENAKSETGCEDYFSGKSGEEVIDLLNENAVLLAVIALVTFLLLLTALFTSGKLLGFRAIINWSLRALNSAVIVFGVGCFIGGIYVASKLNTYEWVAYLVALLCIVGSFIALGGVVALLKESRRLLQIYFGFMMLWSCLLLSFGVVSFAYQDYVSGWLSDHKEDYDTLAEMSDEDAETYLKARLRVAGLIGCTLCVYCGLSVLGTAYLLTADKKRQSEGALGGRELPALYGVSGNV
eukprot:TRINITY_DN18974_c0_g1::TRINITY_DN18974_c0_g1_i1::g.21690::m.21690 TRINITY_DN18974_c0_g1::TRINITY_DN18974_c0_g1_i1::g.21690  ORF type:complete len:402 (+),score=110.87,Tetraspannin/PF00335.15/1.6e-07,Tetraspannin/PF00335.15/26,Tetraspannin/PF00335.15/5.5e-12,Tetraspannin/PF00335.15/7.4e+02,PIRT/PF15099.1/1.1e+02,PIRT/PF15099.1/0.0072,PIRT/PF15099.1/3.1e+03,PIRT/PF15099.1/1.7e+03,Presenilin/PF01080.12/0.018,P12/PF12669.2/0.059,P12/PF12669.2/8.5e+03,P12/PF12669.2/9.6e+03,P12/PF12669.2/1.3e+03,Flu_C